MDRQGQGWWETGVRARRRRFIWASHWALSATLFTLILASGPGVAAAAVISSFGSGAGESLDARGIAVDWETGDLYVVDRGNNRVNVFDAAGDFAFAFGWGVRNGEAALQTCTTATTCQKGLAGAGAGEFDKPFSIAVDNDPSSPSHNDVYVTDNDNLRVEKFGPAGEFLLKFGRAGSGAGEFTEAPNMSVAVGPGGTVYVTDGRLIREQPQEFVNRLEKFSPAGTFVSDLPLAPAAVGRVHGVGVDSLGSVYVATEGLGGGLRKYNSSGELLDAIPDPTVTALSLDSSDRLFTSSSVGSGQRRSVIEYAADGAILRRFGYGPFVEPGRQTSTGLAPFEAPDGDLYLSSSLSPSVGVEQLSFPPPGPLVFPLPCSIEAVKSSSATLQAEINPEGLPTTYHFQYLTQEEFEAGGFANPAVMRTPESASIGSDFELHPAGAEISGLAPETEYRCRVVATNGASASEGEEGSFETLDNFVIDGAWVARVGTDFALLAAAINPLEVDVHGQFEYVDESSFQASGFATASMVPQPPIDFGAGAVPREESTEISGLSSDTVYRYRVVGKSPFKEASGPVHSFRTFPLSAALLPDSRAYEMVSPPQKNNADVAIPGGAGGLVNKSVRPEQAASSGDAVTYASFTAFGEDAQSAPGGSQYLSRRGADGWVTENVTPPYNSSFTRDPLRGFSEDLEQAAVIQREPVLVPGAPQGVENLYLRDPAGNLTLVSSIEPEFAPATKYCVNFMGATADFSHVIFAANGRLTPEAPIVVNGQNLYEYSSADGIRLVSVLPDGSPAAANTSLGFGAGAQDCNLGGQIVKNAISADGSRIFWTAVSGTSRRLYARVEGGETIELDAPQGGAGPAGEGAFWAASRDGSKVFFTDPRELTPGAAPGDLYRYDFDVPAGSRLSDLTAGAVPAAVQGVVGASEDGSYIYLVAQGKLSGEEANSEGDRAVSGEDNLYRWHEGEELKFIATLHANFFNGDESDWVAHPEQQTARVSPDGKHLAFLSIEELTGFDNTDQASDKPDSELFVYDGESGQLYCASCDPSGARPTGPTTVPTWVTPYQQVRYLSDDGSRAFFTTADPLALRDSNGEPDIYEFELAGSGDCTASSSAYSEESGGCVSLISSGASTAPSYLVDASADGSDVFVSTAERLLVRDRDERYDIYDARVDGGFPEASPAPAPCEGESCRAPATVPPDLMPGSASLHSSGNARPAAAKPCPKGRHRVRRKGKSRCAKGAKPRSQKRRLPT